MAHYAVSFRRTAEKDLRKLDAAPRRLGLRSFDALVLNPRPGDVAICMAAKLSAYPATVLTDSKSLLAVASGGLLALYNR